MFDKPNRLKPLLIIYFAMSVLNGIHSSLTAESGQQGIGMFIAGYLVFGLLWYVLIRYECRVVPLTKPMKYGGVLLLEYIVVIALTGNGVISFIQSAVELMSDINGFAFVKLGISIWVAVFGIYTWLSMKDKRKSTIRLLKMSVVVFAVFFHINSNNLMEAFARGDFQVIYLIIQVLFVVMNYLLLSEYLRTSRRVRNTLVNE